MSKKILLLEGDGIGPEIVREAERVLLLFQSKGLLDCEVLHADIGGAAVDKGEAPLPKKTLSLAKASDAILLGAVGGPKWDALERSQRPERGLLAIRSELGLFANYRPAILYDELADSSTLKRGVVAGLDILIVRELTGGIYFGEPRGIDKTEAGLRVGFNTLIYNEAEVRRIAKTAFEAATKRNKRLCSVDKANVLEVSELWRDVVNEVSKDYPDVELSHMYVDNAAMQLVSAPKQFDVMVTTNMFGDILSDCAAMLTGSIGMLPSASLNETGLGLYEPVHGSAPDIAGSNQANPLATILSAAMMLRYSLGYEQLAAHIEGAVGRVLANGLRTRDIASPGTTLVTTSEMGQAVLDELQSI